MPKQLCNITFPFIDEPETFVIYTVFHLYKGNYRLKKGLHSANSLKGQTNTWVVVDMLKLIWGTFNTPPAVLLEFTLVVVASQFEDSFALSMLNSSTHTKRPNCAFCMDHFIDCPNHDRSVLS